MGYWKMIHADGTVEEHHVEQKGWTHSDILTPKPPAQQRKGALELAGELRKMDITKAKAADAAYGEKIDAMFNRWAENRSLRAIAQQANIETRNEDFVHLIGCNHD